MREVKGLDKAAAMSPHQKKELVFEMGAWFPRKQGATTYSFFSIQYCDAAIEVIKAALREFNKSYAIPTLFLINHAFELQLKALILATCESDHLREPDALLGGHELKKLLEWLQNNSWKFDIEIKKLINLLDDLNDWYGLRYPEGKNKKLSKIWSFRSPATRAAYRLNKSYKPPLSVNKLLVLLKGKVADFIWGSLDAFTETGYRGP